MYQEIQIFLYPLRSLDEKSGGDLSCGPQFDNIVIRSHFMVQNAQRTLSRRMDWKRAGVLVLAPAAVAALLCLAAGAVAQTATVLKEGTVYNRPVVFVANDKL